MSEMYALFVFPPIFGSWAGSFELFSGFLAIFRCVHNLKTRNRNRWEKEIMRSQI